MSRRHTVLAAFLIVFAHAAPAVATPEGQMSWALHFSLAPTLFEPAETPGVVSPFMEDQMNETRSTPMAFHRSA